MLAKRLFPVICASLLGVPAAQASIVFDCFSNDRKGYIVDTYVRGLSIYGTVDTLFLARCERSDMLRITDLGPVTLDNFAEDFYKVRGRLVRNFIAKRDTFTFQDVSDALTRSGYTVTYERAVKDGCLCELEN